MGIDTIKRGALWEGYLNRWKPDKRRKRGDVGKVSPLNGRREPRWEEGEGGNGKWGVLGVKEMTHVGRLPDCAHKTAR